MGKNRRSLASMYLERIDPGFAFSSDEVAQWQPQAFAEERVLSLCDHHLVLTWQRVRVLKVVKVGWWEKARSALRPSIANLSIRVLERGMPDPVLWGGLDKEYVKPKDLAVDPKDRAVYGEALYVLPKVGSIEGKRLARAAVSLDPEKWVQKWFAGLDYWHRYIPSIAQAALQAGSDISASTCNRLINCLDVETIRVTKLQTLLDGWR